MKIPVTVEKKPSTNLQIVIEASWLYLVSFFYRLILVYYKNLRNINGNNDIWQQR